MGEKIVSVEGWGEVGETGCFPGSGGVLDDEGEVEGGHGWGGREGEIKGGLERSQKEGRRCNHPFISSSSIIFTHPFHFSLLSFSLTHSFIFHSQLSKLFL